MKNIFDLYEENATPTNTTGMGNPMPASEECNGSEPIIGKKKAKCKKEKCNKVVESSLLDIEGSFEEGNNFANLRDWIDNFKNLSAMSANVSNFVKEIKKNGAKPAYDASVENGKYFVEIIKGDNSSVFSYTLKFYYPDKNEKDYWNHVIIRMQVPRNKLLERKGYKKEIKFLDVKMLKTSITYIKREVAKCISSRTNKMYYLPDKYKGIIKLIKLEERK